MATITQQDILMIRKLADKGVERKDIAKIYNVRCARISTLCVKNNIKNKKIPTMEEDTYLKQLANAGLTYREMSRMMHDKFNKPYTSEALRSRMRIDNIEYKGHRSLWRAEEEARLQKAYSNIGWSPGTIPMYLALFPKRNSGSIRKKIRAMMEMGGLNEKIN